MTEVSMNIVWLAVSVLYMATAVYLNLNHRDVLPITIPAAFLGIGAGLFTAVNRSTFFSTEAYVFAAEVAAIVLLIAAWAMAVWAVYGYLRLRQDVTETND